NYPGVTDNYDFEVIRYPSIDTTRLFGYRAGTPFAQSALRRLERRKCDIIHSHCPAVSGIMARELRERTGAPIVFTYHTKFDIDIENITNMELIQKAAKKLLVSNISACDEVWAVSEGAGRNLRQLGYKGDCLVMPNGVDFPRGRVGKEEIAAVKSEYKIKNLPTLLFVGRIRWYKGLRIIIDAAKMLKNSGFKFQAVFVGEGSDRKEIEKYAEECGVSDICVFTGAVTDRDKLRALFCSADLFTFPSTFDTNGIVVREAAACALPSLLIKDSCAAEGIEDGICGFLCEENSDSAAKAIAEVLKNPEAARRVGINAEQKIYISWEDAVAKAYERYGEILQDYKPKKHFPSIMLK
ncbi:MAG: glycosyltransferase, partial [Acutalibacteraceae bacterium]